MKAKILSLIMIIAMLAQLPVVSAEEQIWDPFNGDKEVNVVYLGGSLTQAEGWRVMLGDWLKEKYEGIVPGRKINNINAGFGGTTSFYGNMRLNDDVIKYEPDLVFVEFSVNDKHLSEAEMTKSMEGIVRRLQGLKNPPIINFVYAHPADMTNTSSIHSKIAEYYDIPEIDFTKAFNALGYYVGNRDAGINYYYSEDKVHTNVFGHTEWSNYAKGLIEGNPQKYFRHSQLRAVPMNKDNYSWISANYITGANALQEGLITVENTDVKDDNLYINPNGKISFQYNDKALAVKSELGAEGSVVENVINGKTYSTNDLRAEGKQDMVALNTASIAENSVVELKVSEDTEKPFKVHGFYFNNGEKSVYPTQYDESVKLNTWEQREEKEDVKAKEEDYFSLLDNLGFLQGCDNAQSDAHVTRGEFAKILANIYGYKDTSSEEWNNEFLGSGAVSGNADNETSKFTDVTSQYQYFNEINFCVSMGLLNGVSDDLFMADNDITMIQAAKVIIDMLGYKKIVEMTSSYPNGYIQIVSDLDLNKNIVCGYNDSVTFNQVAAIIYNAMDEQMIELKINSSSTQYVKSDKTFAEEIFGLKRVNGQMTENEYTSLAAAKKSKDIVIDGITIELPECLKKANEMIGHRVEGYYSEEGELKFIKLNDKEEYPVIYAENEPEFKNNTLYYQINDKKKNVRIKNGAYMIYNGIAVGSYDKNNFDITNGTITLLKTSKASEYDIVIIDNYEDYFVSAADKTNEILYMTEKRVFNDKTKEYVYVQKTIDFENKTIISLKDNKGNDISIADMEAETVVSVAENGDAYKIIYSNVKEDNFTVSRVEKEDYTTIKSQASQYEVEKAYEGHEEFPKFVTGSIYTLYFNAFGRVVWAKGIYGNDIKAGMLISISEDEAENELFAKISDTNSTVKKIYLNERVKFKNAKGETSSLKNNDVILEQLGAYKGLIRYKLNTDGKINYAEVPLTDKTVESENGQLYDYRKIFGLTSNEYLYTSDYSTFSNTNEYLFLQNNIRSFVKKDNITIFSKDNTQTNGRYNCKLNDISSLGSGRTYTAYLYGTDVDFGVAEYVVIEDATEAGKDSNNTLYVVDSVSTEIYGIDEEPAVVVNAKKIAGRNITDVKLVSYVGDTKNASGQAVSKFDYCPDFAGSGKYHSVEKGDIIIANLTEGEEELVKTVYLLFDSSNTTDVADNANPGWFAGINGVYDSTSNFNNPYAVTSSGITSSSNALNLKNWQIRYMLGYVIAYNNGVLRITNKDLSVMNYTNDSSYVEESVTFGNGKNVCITYSSNGKFTVNNITEKDIKTYRTHGNNASRVLTITNRGNVYAVIIMNYEN